MNGTFSPNYEEGHVPTYELPALLEMQNGARVENAAQWRNVRRAEILRLFEENVYGRTPRNTLHVRFELMESGDFGANAIRKQIRIHFADGEDQRHLDLLLYLPKATLPCPLFLGLNFNGNHSICADAAIYLPQSWMPNKENLGVVENKATESGRGAMAHSWPLEKILERGFGVATAYHGDLDPDFDDGFANGIHPLFYEENQTRPASNEWGAIGAWAWGLCRALDYLESDGDVDASRVALFGHSRLGKAALWAGAQDERFALVISNNSGCGGAAIFRRSFGETIAAINSNFPHWFCANFHAFNARENLLPVDQHQLLALLAPRPLYVASAKEDLWADPRGEWLAAYHASPAYELLGVEGHGAREMPGIEEPILSRLGYHIRRGQHGVNAYDWARYLDFADKHMA